MKVKRDKLRQNIEDIIANGVVTGEEVDKTTDKILSEIEVFINIVENYNN